MLSYIYIFYLNIHNNFSVAPDVVIELVDDRKEIQVPSLALLYD